MEYIATDSNFKEETATGTVLVDFWATWCGPCRMQAPILEQLSEELDESELKILKMDVDENPLTPQSFEVMAIPTMVILRDGELVERLVGVHTKDQIKEVLANI
ncbi:MAG: thioredoxin [Streptococcaceae bacterium]|nr:thioredoxin [Streptococcaceae bacterium]